ncbi:MAG: MFS transporter [Cyanobacteria bacterium P01_G01_bin.54]
MATLNLKQLGKLGLLASLYISQLIPLAFLGQALPVYLRQQGASLRTIGLFALMGLPFVLKFLWAPLIDRYGFTRWGHYRFWIICFQLLAAGGTAACAFVGAQGGFMPLLLCLLLLCFVCASQDVATDALAIGLLDPQERGLGNGVQAAGNYLGIIIGGGGMLLLLDRWGWTWTVLAMAAMMLVALLPVLNHREQCKPKVEKQNGLSLRGYLKALTQLFRRPGMRKWLLLMIGYLAGPNLVLAMFRPLLVDMGLSLTEIGLLLGVVSSTAGIVGALSSGFVVAALGRKRSLVVFGVLRAIALCAYLLPAFGMTNLSLIYLIVIAFQFAASMANTTLYTIMMDKSQPETAGTDYTLQNSVVGLSVDGVSIISGVLADALGYGGAFAIGVAIAFLGVGLVATALPRQQLALAKQP